MKAIFIKTMLVAALMIIGLATVNSQLKVDGSGNVLLGSSSSNFLGTNGDFPLTFKVNNVLAGFTGNNASNNVSFGYGSLTNPLTGNYNVAVGIGALANTTTYCNVANGYQALYSNMTGSFNTAVGVFADVNASNLNNTTAIGYNAKADKNSQVVLGNSTIISFKVGVSETTISDGRTKKNIRAEVPGLAFVNQLQPVMYNLDLSALDELQKSDDPAINRFNDSIRMSRSSEEKAIEARARANKEKIVYSGFIAQDVEKAAQSVGYDFSGVDAPENGKGAYGLRYTEFVVPLVKAVQELSAQNEQLQQQINELKGNSATLRSSSNETGTTGIVNPEIAQCKLYQNAPNPFTQDTNIGFYIPDNANTASLSIYDLQGKQLMQYTIVQRGEGSHLISGHHFAAGMYLYALIVDGLVVDTKKMILTK